MKDHTGGFDAISPMDQRRQRIALSDLLGTTAPPAWAGPSSRTVRQYAPAERRTIRMHVPAELHLPATPRDSAGFRPRPRLPAGLRLPTAVRLPTGFRFPESLRLPARLRPAGRGAAAGSAERQPLLIIRFALAMASVALIVLGVGAAFPSAPTELSDDSVAPAAVSTSSPDLDVPAPPALVPSSRPWERPAWVEPGDDEPRYDPEHSDPGPFPEPAVLRAEPAPDPAPAR